MNHKIPEYPNKIIAFVDILGFKEITKSLRDNPDIRKRLHYALSSIKSIEKSINIKSSLNAIYEVSVFSDCVAISTEENKISGLVWTVGWLQAALLYGGILTRGAISSGLLHHSKGIMYGEGIISAYELEQHTAFYPRVVVSNKILEKNRATLLPWLSLDPDGVYYINLFKFDAVGGNPDELAADGYDPRAIYFKVVRDELIKNRKIATEESHLAKQQWMIDNFNRAVIDFNREALEKVELIN